MSLFILQSASKKIAKLMSMDCANSNIVSAFIPKHIIRKFGTLVVGDKVKISSVGQDLVISEVIPRVNVLTRVDPNNPDKKKLIAANIKDLIIVSTPNNPKFKPEFLMRAISLAIMHDCNPIFVLNKMDLYQSATEECKENINEIIAFLKKYNYCVLKTSCNDDFGINDLLKITKKNIFALIGQSGVGKSCIASLLCDRKIQIGELKESGQGRHTTTQSQVFFTKDYHSLCIDTPGIQSIPYYGTSSLVFSETFPGIKEYVGLCKFRDCIHIDTPGCKLLYDVANYLFPEYIYKIYARIICSNQSPQL